MVCGSLFCGFVFVHILVVEAQWLNKGDVCTTPDKEVSTCIEPESCKSINDFLEEARKVQPLPPQVSALLRSHHCGFNGRTPKVCCPSKPIHMEGVTPTVTMEQATQMRNPIPPPPNVSRHKNIGLLPENCGVIDTGDKIISRNKTRVFEFPWMALISHRTNRGPKFKCAATIINEKYILTAAHCITRTKNPLIGVRVGEHNINTVEDCEITREGERYCAPPVQNLEIEEIVTHPDYNPDVYTNDIGLLRVTRMDLTRNTTKPICLPLDRTRNYNFTNRNGLLTGWGVIETGRSSPELLKILLPVTPQEECVSSYAALKRVINYRQMCAGGKYAADSCAGDSGGPLHVVAHLHEDTRLVQQGIVSFGPRDCGRQGLPGVYTRVAYYMDWILDNMKA